MAKRQSSSVSPEATREDYADIERTKAKATETKRLQEIEACAEKIGELVQGIQNQLFLVEDILAFGPRSEWGKK